MTVRQQLAPEVLRARVVEASGRAVDTVWLGRQGARAPLIVTIDHLEGLAGDVQGYAVTLSEVTHRRLEQTVDQACPRAGYVDLTGGRALALDCWVPEDDERVQGRGYLWQHWSLPRLVLERVRRSEDPVVILGEPAGVPDTFAHGLAIEAPERADVHDLWWPRDFPPPVRAYQWAREPALPPVPV